MKSLTAKLTRSIKVVQVRDLPLNWETAVGMVLGLVCNVAILVHLVSRWF